VSVRVAAALLCETSHNIDAVAAAQRDRCRTISSRRRPARGMLAETQTQVLLSVSDSALSFANLTARGVSAFLAELAIGW
jgi:hypothetical protein